MHADELFPGFSAQDVEVDAGVRLRVRTGGRGRPLLLHGHPQTHAIWHKVAPAQAAQFTLVLADLRGYTATRPNRPGTRTMRATASGPWRATCCA
ncbi:alpha/beta fold hydrolase [Pseudorhodoferax sp.]|uniref:alpha/beta fold hydrolase n=1 Tax=Pseudorhodoferax sp. TaxID=1993553 RepID=UPI0039E4634E